MYVPIYFLFNVLGNKISCFCKTSFFLGQSFEKKTNEYVLQRGFLPLRVALLNIPLSAQ